MKIESGIWIGIWIWDSKLRLGLGIGGWGIRGEGVELTKDKRYGKIIKNERR